MGKILFTSESVTEGHPDKICDQISDAILDAIYKEDPMSRVACETAITTDFVCIIGEISTNANLGPADFEKIARKTICEIGYDDKAKGFDGNTCEVIVRLDKQSAEIALGVDNALETKQSSDADGAVNKTDMGMTDAEIDKIGAGDQGMMFGYATNETETYMPYPAFMAQSLSRKLTEVRKNGTLPYLRADGKTQVTVEYDENKKPKRIDALVISSQHSEDVTQHQIHEDIRKYVIDEVVPADMIDDKTRIYINPTGRFVIGGPNGDAGLTGRKIIVDTYGGAGHHGGGAFSGKDPTKVDRSAAYAARWVAKNIVAAGIADKAEIEIGYAIGVAEPVSVTIDTFGTGKYSDEKIIEAVNKVFDLRPTAIIDALDLRRPIYKKTAAYGHFGRDDADFTWEKLNKVEELKAAIQ